MWELVFKLASNLKRWALRYMEINFVTGLKKKYSNLHESLVVDEQELERLITDYATGGDTKLADIDEVFKQMKGRLREVRALALEYREKKEQTNETTKDRES